VGFISDSILDALPEDSWFREWVDAWPLAEPPKSFILLAGMSAFGACVGRRAWFTHDVHTLYPMLNLLLIGPSGIGKSTAITMAFKLVHELMEPLRPQVVAGSSTPEKLHADLSRNPKAILFASELANFFSKQKYMESMIPYVCELLDYRDIIERRTKGEDITTVLNSAVTILGGSTVDWLQQQLPDSAMTGGFLARFFTIYEAHRGQRVPLPSLTMNKTSWQKMLAYRQSVYDRFKPLAAAAEGELTFRDFGASDVFVNWCNVYQPLTGHLAPFAARAGEFVLRLAMLFALSAGRMVLQPEDIKSGIALYEYSASHLQQVVVPFTPKGKLLAMVLQAVGTTGLSDVGIRRAMRNFVSASEADGLVSSLLASRDLIRQSDGLYVRTKNGTS